MAAPFFPAAVARILAIGGGWHLVAAAGGAVGGVAGAAFFLEGTGAGHNRLLAQTAQLQLLFAVLLGAGLIL